ncbi:MAG: winged helix-turn-helix transcriptional regulator [Actinobacteria bacterium]|jgi:ArsR family transcriptional regulator|nr:winged helix-turn-helix transcriptional regulator [Actinomycetota bacterium]MBT3687049.1 winged helix-turn-helix transcriptional regulator [Actinomycetota bacterium]MBT4037478.1 winged helix-turn-helix transcriptional regulator [Actinomycetota bacterium]MBT4279778.1 winged helix-turn-helix transcriptional regulator [Actinomycetota bacterium]MBT4342675.1 winged helix-turn-helix transcriptional regulator [Actinomycetota bacterium]|tara:strand:- start:1602 stop:1937 length:336 start_codon:yes stop_codon:yes gene_type:complete
MSTVTAATDLQCCPPITEAALDDETAHRLAGVFSVLGDPIRLRLFSLIASRPEGSCACDLVGPLGRSQPTISHHLKALHEAGLVDRERRGRWIWYSVRPKALLAAATLISC